MKYFSIVMLSLYFSVSVFAQAGKEEVLATVGTKKITLEEFNKKFAEDVLFKSVKNYLRDRKSLCVVLMDIDHFKKVNDTYGHQAGDYVLSQVALILKAQARDNDIVGRFGGEEFIAILNADTPGSMIFAERFRKKVESTKMIFDGKHIPVTISLGLSTMQEEWSPNCNPDQMMKDLVSQADQALYYSKKNGRNQASHFEKIKEQLKKAA
jgi:diguanylate cyclase (GGDEF)-like protein